MTNPLHARFYADSAVQCRAEVIENVQIARDTYRVRFACPEIAKTILPGQFIMLRLAGYDDPLLGRAFALYDTVLDQDGTRTGLEIVYLVMGKMTSRLARFIAGQQLELWGPLGNGFRPPSVDHLVLVAGGIGQSPFPALAQEVLGHRTYGDPARTAPAVQKVTLCYGARSADFLAGVEDFEKIGVDVRVSTDDGSQGKHGLVTSVLNEVLDEKSNQQIQVVCCGPEPMMKSVAEVAAAAGVSCQVSLETPMACGIGICFSCVAKVRQADGEWDYKRTCVEGPVFDADQIVW
ncbi:MAG: dihydroorotate dehydrogenase electron transfer subunit [Planctomycetales bacterium]